MLKATGCEYGKTLCIHYACFAHLWGRLDRLLCHADLKSPLTFLKQLSNNLIDSNTGGTHPQIVVKMVESVSKVLHLG